MGGSRRWPPSPLKQGCHQPCCTCREALLKGVPDIDPCCVCHAAWSPQTAAARLFGAVQVQRMRLVRVRRADGLPVLRRRHPADSPAQRPGAFSRENGAHGGCHVPLQPLQIEEQQDSRPVCSLWRHGELWWRDVEESLAATLNHSSQIVEAKEFVRRAHVSTMYGAVWDAVQCTMLT